MNFLRTDKMESMRQDYIKYFSYMQEEDNEFPLGGMAWDDISWQIHEAVDVYNLFTRKELADMFPDLLGHIKD